MHPILLDIPLSDSFRLTLGSYGFMCAVAVILGTWMAMWTGERNGVGKDAAIDLVLIHCLGVLLGAKGLQLIVEWDRFADNPWAWFSVREMGIFYGGLIGSVTAVSLRAHFKGWNKWQAWDALAPAFAFGHGITRVGCFLAGCCYGGPSPFGVEYPSTSAAYRSLLHGDISLLDGGHTVLLFPIQLVEAGAEVFLAGVLLWLLTRGVRHGTLLLTYLSSYAVLRFVLEMFRFDPERGYVLGGWLSTSQGISVALLVLAGVGWWWRYRPGASRE